MAGGGGTRLWPASRKLRPKQFLPMLSGGETLLGATVARVQSVVPPERILVVTAADQVAEVQHTAPSLPAANIVIEPKARYAEDDWYDVWFPTLAPSLETMKLAQTATSAGQWSAFTRKYRAEMSRPEARHALDVLAALSHTSNFSIGCYCADESHCHRSILRALLNERGAAII